MPPKYIRGLLIAYGLSNAVLYSSLLPLWEGFDEEFHYGYVQFLEAHGRLPVLGQTGLSEEINRSIDLLPMSFVMIENLQAKGVRTFDQYFALDSEQRHQLFDQAHHIPTDLRLQENPRYHQNYEVHHAPLAHILMAIPDTPLAQVPLPYRVWILRLLVATSSVVLMFHGTLALAHEAGLDDTYSYALLFLIYCCQMFWATIAHVGNDWLAVPLAVWLMVRALRFHREPSPRNAAWLAITLALGLLTKAYFLVFVPLYLLAALIWFRKRVLPARTLTALVLIPLALAGPWYARNLIVSGNLSGRLEESSGVTTGSALGSLAAIPWLKSLPFMARGAFWLANGSFTDFSVRTMNALLVLLALALLLYCWTARLNKTLQQDAFLWSPAILFCAAMIYVTGSTYAFSKGSVTVASPWYLQAVMAQLLTVAMLGCQRSGRPGRGLAAVTVTLWGYILAVTYVAKLFPMYGGFAGGRSTLRDIGHWYLSDWSRTSDILNTNAMLPANGLLALLALVLLLLFASLGALLRSLAAKPENIAFRIDSIPRTPRPFDHRRP